MKRPTTQLQLECLEGRDTPNSALPRFPIFVSYVPTAANPLRPPIVSAPTPPVAVPAPNTTSLGNSATSPSKEPIAPPAPTTPTTPTAPSNSTTPSTPNTSTPNPTQSPSNNAGTTTRSMLSGTVQGNYTSTLRIVDTPSGFHFSGTANIGELGVVNVYAHVYSVGFKARGNARGEVLISSHRGTLRLELSGPEQTRLSPLPEQFRYRVVGGTGDFRSVRESGTLRITRKLDPVPIRNGIQYVETGTFRLTI